MTSVNKSLSGYPAPEEAKKAFDCMTNDEELIEAIDITRQIRNKVEGERKVAVRLFEVLQKQWKARKPPDEVLECLWDGELSTFACEKAELLK